MTQRTCEKDGCGKPHFSRGMCKSHYRRDYYLRNKERENANFRAYREANLERERQRFADWYETSGRKRGATQRASKAANEGRTITPRARTEEAKAAKRSATHKACTRCEEVKAVDLFHTDPRRVDGRYSWCKACFSAHVVSMRTPETEAERRRRAYANPETREKLLAKHRAWSKVNPEKNREYANRRRATIVAATVEQVDYAGIIERDGMLCHLCKAEIPGLEELHFDHVVPIARGGEHSMANIKPAHATCNLRKHDKLISELDWVVTA